MKYLYEAISRPSRLYIKQCSHCGLKYFGKTISDDVEGYQGSGKYWKSHIRKHNADVIHLWHSDWYYDTSITRFALKFSRLNKIVNSSQWANLVEENGIDGNNFQRDAAMIEKYKNTVNSLEWKETIGKESTRKMLETKNNKRWKETVGIEAYRKVSEKSRGNPRPWAGKNFQARNESIKSGDIISPHTKVWKVTEPNGNVIIVENLASFCKENNLSQGNFSKFGKTKGYSVVFIGYLLEIRSH